MPELSIVTFNTWNCQGRFSRRLPLMIRGLMNLRADVILLQEVFAQAPTGFHVGKRLAEALGLYLSFVPARRKLRTLNGAPILSHSGLAILSKTPILKSRTVRLPADPRDGERLAQVALIQVNGLHIQIGNVHLTHLPDGDALRREQLKILMNNLIYDADIALIGGDMNAPHGHDVFSILDDFQMPHFADEFPVSSLNRVNGNEPPPGVIDHLFVRSQFGRDATLHARMALDVADERTGLYASDHKAVVATLIVP